MIKQKFKTYWQKIASSVSSRLPPRLRGLNGILGIIIAIIILVVIIVTLVERSSSKSTINIAPIAVEVATVKQQTIPVNIDALGSLEADQQIDVSPEVDGQIAKVEFTNGENVKVGKTLFQLDDSVAQAQLAGAKARLQLSKENFERNRKLLAHDALSQQALDQAKEQLAEDKANVDEQRLLVEKMRLTAPFAGTVGSRTVSVGQYVSVGQTLVTLVNTNSLKVIYHVPEVYLSQLKLGQTVEITSDALPGEKFSGTVSYISPAIDVTTRTVEVHATVPNDAQQLAPGMFVKVEQELSERPNALVIPSTALVATISGSEVYVAEKGHAIQTPVKVGVRFGDTVEITSGLQNKQQVVVAGQQKLHDGSAIQIIDNTKASA